MVRDPWVTEKRIAGFIARMLVWMVLGTVLLPGIFSEPDRLVIFHDEEFFHSHEEAARRTLVEYGQWFAWNPYHCGGIPGFSNPQDTSLAPDFVLNLLFGTTKGRRLRYLLFFLFGLEGMFQLCRRHGVATAASMVAAVFFSMSGRFQSSVEAGHLHFWGFQLIPWVVLCFERGLEHRGWRVLGGVFMTWLLFLGGTYPVPFATLVLAFFWGWRTIESVARGSPRRWYVPSVALLGMAAVTVGLSAIRLLPMAKIVFEQPRMWWRTEWVPPQTLTTSLFEMPNPDLILGGEAYVGPMIGAMAVLAVLVGGRRARATAVGVLLFAVLSLGEYGDWSLYGALRTLPVFDQLRDPFRYVIVVVFFVVLLAAHGLSWIERLPITLHGWVQRLQRGDGIVTGVPRYAGMVIGALSVVAIASHAWPNLVAANSVRAEVFVQEVPRSMEQPFRQSRGNRWDAATWPLLNLGSLQCFEETKFRQSAALRADLEHEEYLLERAAGAVVRQSWSPNRIRLRVDVDRPTTVLINQNYHSSWRSSVGEVFDHQGLLAVRVPAGVHELTVRFVDVPSLLGALVTLVTAAGLIFWAWRR